MDDNEHIACAFCKHAIGIEGRGNFCTAEPPVINAFTGATMWPRLDNLKLRCGQFTHRFGSMVEVFAPQNEVVTVIWRPNQTEPTVFSRTTNGGFTQEIGIDLMRRAMDAIAKELSADSLLRGAANGGGVVPLKKE